MGIWHSRQTTSLRGNRFYRRPERSHLLRSISFSTIFLKEPGDRRDVHVISIVWLVMIGDFQSKGNFPSVSRRARQSTAGQIGSQGGSIVGSTDRMVLHRPVELARLIGS